MKALSPYSKASKALAEARTIDDVKTLIDKAAAMREYARRAKDAQLIDDATEIQQDAARKAGAMLAEMEKAKGAREPKTKRGTTRSSRPTASKTLAELGISKDQSSRWQKLAALDEATFEKRKAKARHEAVASIERTKEERQEAKKERRTKREAELGKQQVALPDRKFGLILADPAWRFAPYSTDTGMDRSADNHYPTQTVDEIKALDVASIAADDCVLFLWATAPMLPQALEVMAAWGFAYKTGVVWVKDKMGTGYWFRNFHEHLLVGVKGNVPAPAMGDQFPSAIQTATGRHSAKPEVFLEIIERYFPSLPKVELNRRGPTRDGWSGWGNEAEQPRAAE